MQLLLGALWSKGTSFRSSHSEVFLRKGVLKICSKFTGEHPCRSAISGSYPKSHFGMGVLLKICCIFSEHLFFRTPLSGCFCSFFKCLCDSYLFHGITKEQKFCLSERLLLDSFRLKKSNLL